MANRPSSVKATEMRLVWCLLVHALPLVDEWSVWIGGTQYPNHVLEQL